MTNITLRGLDGKDYKVNLPDYLFYPDRQRSQFAHSVYLLLHELYPLETVCEEVYLPGCPSKLYLDWFLPRLRVGVECDGAQHEQHVTFFHKTKADFLRGQWRDRQKNEWCALNNVKLIRLSSQEGDSIWRAKLRNL